MTTPCPHVCMHHGLGLLFLFLYSFSIDTIQLNVSETVVLTSPNYPSNYPNNVYQTWIITTPSDAYGVQVNFTHFHLESCCDYVRIYAGSTPSYRDRTRLGVFFNTSLPPIIESPYMYLWITFTSDSSVTFPGFRVEVKALDLTGNFFLNAL